MDEFKKTVLRFRRHPDNPDRVDDLNQLIDFSDCSSFGIVQPQPACQPAESVKLDPDDNDCYQGPVYTLPEYPGFLYAPDALSLLAQLQLAHQAVSTYCQAPHTTNIQLVPPKEHEVLSDMPMWELWKREHIFQERHPTNMTSCDGKPHYMSFHKLAWSTMGYHYNWTARAYPAEMASIVPKDLDDLSQRFAKTSLWHNSHWSTVTTVPSFRPTACIVNYYHNKSIMGPHRDDSEHAVTKPIVSFSMGRPAVFLLGGDTRNDPVVPLLVRPGDVMIMGGETRLNYHCMARLLPAGAAALNDAISDDNVDLRKHQVAEIKGMPVPSGAERAALEQYLTEHRININLRQVYDD